MFSQPNWKYAVVLEFSHISNLCLLNLYFVIYYQLVGFCLHLPSVTSISFYMEGEKKSQGFTSFYCTQKGKGDLQMINGEVD